MAGARPLTATERTALDFMLTVEIPSVPTLREQSGTARVVGRCKCGCPTIDIEVERGAPPILGMSGDNVVAMAVSRNPSYDRLMLWVSDGYLSGLELSWIAHPPPGEFPSPKEFAAPAPN
jgi:hypothetical protein